MPNVSLAVYTVRVKTAHTRRDFEILDSLSDEAADLWDVLREILESRKSIAYRKRDAKQALEVLSLNAKNRYIEGRLHFGDYGTESEIRNLGKWGKVAYKKKVLDVDLRPFYFLFYIPEGKDIGTLILQRTGIVGPLTILAEALSEPFVKRFPDQRIHLNTFIPEQLIEEVNREGKPEEILFIRHQRPSDVTKLIGPSGTEQSVGEYVLRMKLRDSGPIQAIQTFLRRQQAGASFVEFNGTRFQYDEAKIKLKFRGKDRTLNLDNPEQIRASFDVSDDLKFGRDGHPIFKSISDAAKGILADIQIELYGRAADVT